MSIPHLYVEGNHYEVGNKIGSEFKYRIKQYLDELNGFFTNILPFIQSDFGKEVMNGYASLIKTSFPWYFDELKGISDGCEIDFDWILAINCRVEIFHFLDKENCQLNKNMGCTDIFLFNQSSNLIVHNEDSSPAVYNTCYIVTCKINSSYYDGVLSPSENFTTYCYPGHLPGNACGFNSDGFAFAVNALYPKKIILNRLPRQLLTRYMLSAKSLTEFEHIIMYSPISYGLSINLGYCGNDLDQLKSEWNDEYFENRNKKQEIFPNAFNYEITSNELNERVNNASKHCIISSSIDVKDNKFFTKGYYFHSNLFQTFEIDQVFSNIESSLQRITRLKIVKKPTNLKELLDVASNTQDNDFPIFRTPTTIDSYQTVASVVFDLKERTMSIFIKKPSSDYTPFIKLLIN